MEELVLGRSVALIGLCGSRKEATRIKSMATHPCMNHRTSIGSKSRLLFKLIANDLILINGNMN